MSELNDQKSHETSTRSESKFRKILNYVPTVAVLLALGGIAYWGHRTGWAAPRFSDLVGTNHSDHEEDWCAEHNVPDSRCIKCHPELVGANTKDWCPEHGLPESKCTICHPEILKTGVAGDWCPEHQIPESSCTLCHPEIAVKGKAPESDHAHDAAHVSVDPEHTHAKDPKTCQTHALRVQFASVESVRKAGVELGQVVERPMSAVMTANAEVQYNRNRVAQISSPVGGKVWRVEKEIGDSVKQGEVIALIDSANVGAAKAEYLQAVADLELKSQTSSRLRSSAESGFRTSAELQEAEAAVKAANIRVFNARQALINLGLKIEPNHPEKLDQTRIQFLGLPQSIVEKLDVNTTTANLLPLIAPFDGTVTERNVVAGEVVEVSKLLLVIADTRLMWITADLSVADAKRIKVGQDVTFEPDGTPDERSRGSVTWISTAVDDQTRTVKIRADVSNDENQLLAHTFGKAQITFRESTKVIAVPTDAIQWEGCCYITFVRLTDDIFQTRKVKLGAKSDGFQEVTIGLLPGEVVATTGSYVLKSEILKSALGAGCAEHGH